MPLLLLLLAFCLRAQAADWAAWVAAHPPEAHPEPDYHFAAEVWAEIEAARVANPGHVEPFEVGRSVLDQPIWGFRVPPANPQAWHRKVLIFANIHALEWVPTEVALQTLLQAAAHPPPGVELTVVPVLNPDGREKVERDLVAGRNVYRRGNQRQVDLNRDFTVWREPDAVWAGLLPGRFASTEAALSQPESRALDALAAAERYDVAVSLHAFGGFLYYPWTGRWKRPPDWARLQALGRTMEAAMGPHAYKTKQLSRWGFFFRAQGSEIDHLYGRYGALAFLVETTRSGLSPLHPGDRKVHFRWYNPRRPAPHVARCLDMGTALIAAVGDPSLPYDRATPPLPAGSPPPAGRSTRAAGRAIGGSGREPPPDAPPDRSPDDGGE